MDEYRSYEYKLSLPNMGSTHDPKQVKRGHPSPLMGSHDAINGVMGCPTNNNKSNHKNNNYFGDRENRKIY